MKNKKLIKWIMPFLCVGILASSCNNNDINSINEEALTGLITANCKKESKVKTPYPTLNVGSENDINNYSIVASYPQYGILVLKNKLGYIGFYNMFYGRFIVKCYLLPTCQYRIRNCSAGTFILYEDRQGSKICDYYGNELARGEFNNFYVETVLNETNNERTNFRIVIDQTTIKHFSYDENLSLKKLDNSFDYTPSQDDNEIGNVGELTDNQKYTFVGNDGQSYFAVINKDAVTVYDGSSSPINTLYCENDSSDFIFIGGKVMYQRNIRLNLGAETFDYCIQEVPYAHITYLVDLLDNKVKTVDFNYVIESGYGYKDNDGQYTYSVLKMSAINDNFGLDPLKEYVVNDELEVISECTGLEMNDFIKTNNGFYNTKTKMLYDNNLKIIHSFGKETINYYKEIGIFIYRDNFAKYHILKDDGNEISGTYEDIITNDQADNIILKQDRSYYLVAKSELISGNSLNKIKLDDFSLVDKDLGIYINKNNLYSLKGLIMRDLPENREDVNFYLTNSVVDKDRACLTLKSDGILYNYQIHNQNNTNTKNLSTLGYEIDYLDLSYFITNGATKSNNTYEVFRFSHNYTYGLTLKYPLAEERQISFEKADGSDLDENDISKDNEFVYIFAHYDEEYLIKYYNNNPFEENKEIPIYDVGQGKYIKPSYSDSYLSCLENNYKGLKFEYSDNSYYGFSRNYTFVPVFSGTIEINMNISHCKNSSVTIDGKSYSETGVVHTIQIQVSAMEEVNMNFQCYSSYYDYTTKLECVFTMAYVR